jgi:hypothetical protein
LATSTSRPSKGLMALTKTRRVASYDTTIEHTDSYKITFRKNLLASIANAGLKIASLCEFNRGVEIGALEFKSKYNQWCIILGWQTKEYRSRNNLSLVSILFKGLGSLDDENISKFGKMIGGLSFIKFERNKPNEEGIPSCNVRLYFNEFPIKLYLQEYSKFTINDLDFRYYVSYQLTCSTCCLKGHNTKFCPFQKYDPITSNRILLAIGKKAPKYFNLGDVPLDLKMLETEANKDLTQLLMNAF